MEESKTDLSNRPAIKKIGSVLRVMDSYSFGRPDFLGDLLECFAQAHVQLGRQNALMPITKKDMVVLALEAAKDVNADARPRIEALWRINKIPLLASINTQKRFQFTEAPLIAVPAPHGKMARGIAEAVAKLHSDGYVDVGESKSKFLLTEDGSRDLLPQIEAKLDWDPEVHNYLMNRLRYWILISNQYPKQMKEYTWYVSQRQSFDDSRKSELEKMFDAYANPILEEIHNEETPPRGELELARRHREDVPLEVSIKEDEIRRVIYSPRPAPGLLKRSDVQSSDDIFPEGGVQTNYRIPPPGRDQHEEICRLLLTFLGKSKSRKLVASSEEWRVLRVYSWQAEGIFLYLLDNEGRATPFNHAKELVAGDRVVIFKQTDDGDSIDKCLSVLKQKNVSSILFLCYSKDYTKIRKWRQLCDVVVLVQPHKLGYLFGEGFSERIFTIDDLKHQARSDGVDRARSFLPATIVAPFGSFMSSRGVPTGFWFNQKMLRGDLWSHFDALVSATINQVRKSGAELILASRDMELTGRIGRELGLPLAKLVPSVHSRIPYVNFNGEYFELYKLGSFLQQKRIAYVSLFDSLITKDVEGSLCELGRNFQVTAHTVIDRLELGPDFRTFVPITSALSIADYWLLEETKSAVEREFLFRKEIHSQVLRERSVTSRLPELHYLDKFNTTRYVDLKLDPLLATDEHRK